jgi:alcohol dehydrogenase
VQLARRGGTVVVAGTRGTDATPGFDPDQIVYKELRVLGALGVDATAYAQALELLAARRFPFETLPRRAVTFDAVDTLLQDMAGEGDLPPVHGVVMPEVTH